MIVGLGLDIAEIDRIEAAIVRHGAPFLERLFTPAEVAYCERHKGKYERYAARFAAKEAAMKALGTGWSHGVRWRDIEVTREPSGKPTLRLAGRRRADRAAHGREEYFALDHAQRQPGPGRSDFRKLGRRRTTPRINIPNKLRAIHWLDANRGRGP